VEVGGGAGGIYTMRVWWGNRVAGVLSHACLPPRHHRLGRRGATHLNAITKKIGISYSSPQTWVFPSSQTSPFTATDFTGSTTTAYTSATTHPATFVSPSTLGPSP
jgi:hypothetical protein